MSLSFLTRFREKDKSPTKSKPPHSSLSPSKSSSNQLSSEIHVISWDSTTGPPHPAPKRTLPYSSSSPVFEMVSPVPSSNVHQTSTGRIVEPAVVPLPPHRRLAMHCERPQTAPKYDPNDNLQVSRQRSNLSSRSFALVPDHLVQRPESPSTAKKNHSNGEFHQWTHVFPPSTRPLNGTTMARTDSAQSISSASSCRNDSDDTPNKAKATRPKSSLSVVKKASFKLLRRQRSDNQHHIPIPPIPIQPPPSGIRRRSSSLSSALKVKSRERAVGAATIPDKADSAHVKLSSSCKTDSMADGAQNPVVSSASSSEREPSDLEHDYGSPRTRSKATVAGSRCWQNNTPSRASNTIEPTCEAEKEAATASVRSMGSLPHSYSHSRSVSNSHSHALREPLGKLFPAQSKAEQETVGGRGNTHSAPVKVGSPGLSVASLPIFTSSLSSPPPPPFLPSSSSSYSAKYHCPLLVGLMGSQLFKQLSPPPIGLDPSCFDQRVKLISDYIECHGSLVAASETATGAVFGSAWQAAVSPRKSHAVTSMEDEFDKLECLTEQEMLKLVANGVCDMMTMVTLHLDDAFIEARRRCGVDSSRTHFQLLVSSLNPSASTMLPDLFSRSESSRYLGSPPGSTTIASDSPNGVPLDTLGGLGIPLRPAPRRKKRPTTAPETAGMDRFSVGVLPQYPSPLLYDRQANPNLRLFTDNRGQKSPAPSFQSLYSSEDGRQPRVQTGDSVKLNNSQDVPFELFTPQSFSSKVPLVPQDMSCGLRPNQYNISVFPFRRGSSDRDSNSNSSHTTRSMRSPPMGFGIGLDFANRDSQDTCDTVETSESTLARETKSIGIVKSALASHPAITTVAATDPVQPPF